MQPSPRQVNVTGKSMAIPVAFRLVGEQEANTVCWDSRLPGRMFPGVVEGFYGTPWSHEARLRQLRFYGENKLNTYIYGSKDDLFHSSPNWREPYPEAVS